MTLTKVKERGDSATRKGSSSIFSQLKDRQVVSLSPGSVCSNANGKRDSCSRPSTNNVN